MLEHALSPGQGLAVAVLCLAGVAAFGITPDTALDTVTVERVSRALPVPAFVEVSDVDDRYWREERVQRGDTIGSLLARAAVDDSDAMQFLRADPSARALYQLRPGGALKVATDDDGRLTGLRFLSSNGDMLSIGRSASGFVAQREKPVEDMMSNVFSWLVSTSGWRTTIRPVSRVKNSSTGLSLTTILPSPRLMKTRATDVLRRPVP